jgi:hypothetical protein
MRAGAQRWPQLMGPLAGRASAALQTLDEPRLVATWIESCGPRCDDDSLPELLAVLRSLQDANAAADALHALLRGPHSGHRALVLDAARSLATPDARAAALAHIAVRRSPHDEGLLEAAIGESNRAGGRRERIEALVDTVVRSGVVAQRILEELIGHAASALRLVGTIFLPVADYVDEAQAWRVVDALSPPETHDEALSVGALLEALAPALARGEPHSLRALIRRLCTQHTALGVLSAVAPHLSRPLEVHSTLEFVKIGFSAMNRRAGLLAVLPYCTDAQQCEVLDSLLAGPIGLRSQIPALALESLGPFAKRHLHDVAEILEPPGPAEAAAFAAEPPDLVEILRGGANQCRSARRPTKASAPPTNPHPDRIAISLPI